VNKLNSIDIENLSFDQLAHKLEKSPEYYAIGFYSGFMDFIYDELKKQRISKKELAKRIGVKPAYVSQILKRKIRNPSVTTLSNFLLALGFKFKISFEDFVEPIKKKGADQQEDVKRIILGKKKYTNYTEHNKKKIKGETKKAA